MFISKQKKVVLRTSKQIINQPSFVNDIPKFWLVKAPRHVGWRTMILPFNISRVVFDRLKDAQRKTVVLSQVDNVHIYVRLCTASRSSGARPPEGALLWNLWYDFHWDGGKSIRKLWWNSWENLWFAVDLPFSQSSDNWKPNLIKKSVLWRTLGWASLTAPFLTFHGHVLIALTSRPYVKPRHWIRGNHRTRCCNNFVIFRN